MTEDSGSYVLSFGKHEGKVLRDVPLSYLFWLSDQDLRSDGLRDAVTEQLAFRRQHEEIDMPFGKYEGDPISGVPSSYLEWFIEDVEGNEGLKDAMQDLIDDRKHGIEEEPDDDR